MRIIDSLEYVQQKNILKIQPTPRYPSVILFFIFGFYGWGTPSIEKIGVIDLLVLLLIGLSFWASFKFSESVKFVNKTFHISLLDLINFTAFFTLSVLLNWKSLITSLTADQLNFAWVSQLHSYVLGLQIYRIFPNQLKGVNSQIYFQTLSLLIFLGVLIVLYSLIRIKTDKSFLVAIISMTLASRFLLQIAGGNPDSNMALGSIWYFFTTSIGGVNDLSFKLSSMIVGAFLSAFVINSVYKFVGMKAASYLVSSLLLTLPLVGFIFSTVEAANWGFVLTTVLLIQIVVLRQSNNPRVILLAAIAFYFRLTNISILVALTLSYLISRRRFPDKETGRHLLFAWIYVSPGLFYLVFSRLMKNVTQENISYLGILNKGISYFQTLESAIPPVFSLMGVILIVISLYARNTRLTLVTFISSTFFLFLVLNSTDVVRSSKYIVEYFLPIAFCSILTASIWVIQKGRRYQVLVLLILLSVNLNNLSEGSNQVRKFVDNYRQYGLTTERDYSVLPSVPLDYKSVYSQIDLMNYGECFNAGVVYSVFPEILNGLSLSEVSSARLQRKTLLSTQQVLQENSFAITPESAGLAEIDCVILGYVETKITLPSFLDQGWSLKFTSSVEIYETKVFLIVKEGQGS